MDIHSSLAGGRLVSTTVLLEQHQEAGWQWGDNTHNIAPTLQFMLCLHYLRNACMPPQQFYVVFIIYEMHMHKCIYIGIPSQQFMLSSLAGHIWRNSGSHLQRVTHTNLRSQLSPILHWNMPFLTSDFFVLRSTFGCISILASQLLLQKWKIGVGNRKRKIENVKSETGHKLAPGEG